MARHATAAPPAATLFDISVFVNCPFDDDYLPLLHTLLFTIHDCGFVARIAVEDAGGAEMRIEKIVRLVRESKYSVHDISRVEWSAKSKLPRFNMPFEAGIAFGAIRFAPNDKRDLLLLEAEAYRDQKTLSDLAGQDTKVHDNDPQKLIEAVRTFLARKRGKGTVVRGAADIWARYQQLNKELPLVASSLKLTHDEVSSFAYLVDWLAIVEDWILAGRGAAL